MDEEDEYLPLHRAIWNGDVGEVQTLLLETPDIDLDHYFATDEEDGRAMTPLNRAIYRQNKEIVELLLAHGASVNTSADAIVTFLQQACYFQPANQEIIEKLLDHYGADVDAITPFTMETPLTLSCGSNTNLSIARLLINAGADVNGGDGVNAPLHRAAENGNTEAIELLLEAGADVNKVTTDDDLLAGSTPLHVAVENKKLSAVNILLAAGADPNIANSVGQTPLHRAAWDSLDIVNALLDAGGDPLHQDNDGRPPVQYLYHPVSIALFDAIEAGDATEVESLLHTPGIDVDYSLAIEGEEKTSKPLSRAIYRQNKEIVELLLARGASVKPSARAIVTSLQQACYFQPANEEIIRLLLDHPGADVDAITPFTMETPLTLATKSSSNLSFAQLLINAGADVNGGGGVIAPLHNAAENGNTAIMELLIEAGADVNKVTTEDYDVLAGSTPLHLAVDNKKLSAVNILVAAGADPNIANSAGETALPSAALWSSVDIVNALLDAGGDPLHQDNDGRTTLQHLYYMIGFSTQFNSITALVAAGDRSWQCVPTPCPGLEAAMLSVWQNAPDELPELVKRMENPPRNLIELFPRMDDEEMKKVVQEVLRGLHRHYAGFPELKDYLLNSIFDFDFEVAVDAVAADDYFISGEDD